MAGPLPNSLTAVNCLASAIPLSLDELVASSDGKKAISMPARTIFYQLDDTNRSI